MRITENHLRRIIRSVIKESSGSNEKNHILSQKMDYVGFLNYKKMYFSTMDQFLMLKQLNL